MNFLLRFCMLGLLWFGLLGTAWSAAPTPVPAQARCPVCGMFVAKYPEWVAVVVWKDGEVHYFDGAKELFKFVQNVAHYAPGRQAEGIAALLVTDYYGLSRMEARHAWYVLGSDVYGPMGHELIPTASEEEAKEFLTDHNGKKILRFDDITPAVLRSLEKMEIQP